MTGLARRRLTSLLVTAAVLFGLTVTLTASTSSTPAEAADPNAFRAGNIIADSVFTNVDTMSQANIQSFLEAKVPSCVTGYTCLRDFRQDTVSRGSDAQCAAYAGAAGERASTIISKVSRACGINPMVLLVLLQKETSLITKTTPTWDNAYKKATGYGCPDTAPCDAQYFGFYNQVYRAAWQYKRYANNPDNYSYRPGRSNYVQWNPNANCGGSWVYIENKATAALYIYTPYAPNSAAMNNLYGSGDSCSAYGNRNFWRLFTDWFGSTQVSFSVVGAISGAYDRVGGSSGELGDAVGNQYPTAWGGWSQAFQNGRIHYHPATGAHAVIGPLAAEYDSIGGETSILGYPVGDRYATAWGGWTQAFQYGRIHYHQATGAHAVAAEIGGTYDSVGGETSVLGYPISDRYPTAWGGWTQAFQYGRIHFHQATGAHVVRGVVSAAYDSVLGERGELGYPVGAQYPTANNGTTQAFQYGRIHHSPATGAHPVIGPLSTAFDAAGGEGGPMGYPIADRYRTAGNGWTQPFQSGRIHWSASTGAHAVTGPVSVAYDARSGEAGALGYPVSDQYATVAGGVAQTFENGSLVISSGGQLRTVMGAIGTAYRTLGGAVGALGEPTSAETASAGGTVQSFQNGRVVDGPNTGAHAISGAVLTAWDASGGAAGPLGWPTGEQSSATGSPVQRFENGLLVVTGGGVRSVMAPLAAAWLAQGGTAGPLGDPVAEGTVTAGSRQQSFANGVLVDGPQTGTRAVVEPMAAAWAAAGQAAGALGFPVSERYPTAGGGWTQPFQKGRVHALPGTGAWPVTGAMSAAYDALSGEAGVLGYPTGTATTAGGATTQPFQKGQLVLSAGRATAVLGSLSTAYTAAGGPGGALGVPVSDRYPTANGGWTQPFTNGRVHSSPTTGAHAVVNPISPAYDALQGEAGALGYPISDRYPTANGGWTQAFQNGRVHTSPTTGAFAVLAPISGAYDALGGEGGALGYPVSSRYATPGNGWTQAFQNGRIHYSPSTGAHAVLTPISPAYDALRGESGALGYPISDRYPTANGGWTQAFQNGRVHTSPTTGAYAVLAPVSSAYDALGGEGGELGYPVGDRVATPGGGYRQEFERGSIAWTPGGGAVVTRR